MRINPVAVKDFESIAKMYVELGFVVIGDAIDPRIVREVRERIPDYIKQKTNNFEQPIDKLTEDIWVKSLDLEQEREDQRVRRWQVCWGYNEKSEEGEPFLETFLRRVNGYFCVPSFGTLKAIAQYHNIPLPKRMLPTYDMYFYKNLSDERKEWTLPWHTDTVSIIAMFGGEEGLLEFESPITKERYNISLEDGQAAIGFGKKMIRYLKVNGAKTEVTETPHRVVIPANYETRVSFTGGLQFETENS